MICQVKSARMRGRIAVVRGQARVSQLKPKSKGATFNSMFGETRGVEAFDLLQLLNTGHSGTLSTVHANSAVQGISRFTTCVLQSGVEMPYLAIKSNIAELLNVIVQIERRPGKRFVSEVLEIRGYDLSTDQYDFRRVAVAQPNVCQGTFDDSF